MAASAAFAPLPQEAGAEGRFAGMFSRCEAVVACEADESDALGGAHGLHGAEPPRAEPLSVRVVAVGADGVFEGGGAPRPPGPPPGLLPQ